MIKDISELDKPKGRTPRKEKVKKERRRRSGLGLETNMRLHIPDDQKDPNYHYHWLNDSPGRIAAKTVKDDYDIVTEAELREGGENVQVKRAVGTGANGEWQYAYLCKKPKEYYDGDKATEQESIASAEKAAKEGAPPGADGLSTSDHGYVPDGHKNVIG